jgi:hypothetical protein
MIIVDRLLVGGLKFVLDKVAQAVDKELNDPTRLREELLAAQMQLELGEIDEDEFRAIERDVFDRLRELKKRQGGPETGHTRVTGAEIVAPGDED